MVNDLTHFSLFTGIGGIDLAAEWAGFKTVGQVEFAEYPFKVLCEHWPDIPKWRDIRDVTIESIRREGIERITVLSGGFPCQPFSCAGKRAGKEDPRFLWKEMFRLVSELKPNWVVGENVVGIVSMELDNCLFDLESIDYTTRTFVIPACAINAPHNRDRVFIVAHSNSIGFPTDVIQKKFNKEISKKWIFNDTNLFDYIQRFAGSCARNIRRDDGIPYRLDQNKNRIRCLGNAVVPQQIYPLLQIISNIEQASK